MRKGYRTLEDEFYKNETRFSAVSTSNSNYSAVERMSIADDTVKNRVEDSSHSVKAKFVENGSEKPVHATLEKNPPPNYLQLLIH